MSTSKRAKLARQQMHQRMRIERKRQELFGNLNTKPKEFVDYVPSDAYRRETKHYPSLSSSSSVHDTAKREPQRYTGSLIKGIATMHKSNAVPVISEEHAKDISKMRRG